MDLDHVERIEGYNKALTILCGMDDENSQHVSHLTRIMKELDSDMDSMRAVIKENKSSTEEMKQQLETLQQFQIYLDEIDSNLPEDNLEIDQENCDPSELSYEIRRVADSQGDNGRENGAVVWSDQCSISLPPAKTNPPSQQKLAANNANGGAAVEWISVQEFNTVHKYMRGRLTVDNINSLVDALNTVLKRKYTILKMPKNKLDKADRDRLLSWKVQERNAGMRPGACYFCTAADLERLAGYKMDKLSLNAMVILRHLKRIKEIRCENDTFYTVNN